MSTPQFDIEAVARCGGLMEKLREYVIDGRRRVPGWFQDGAASVVWSLLEGQKAFNIVGDVTEIGVYHGKLFIALALSTDGAEKAYALDPFGMSGEKFLERFLANLAEFGVSNRCRVMQGMSGAIQPEKAKNFFGENNRFVSVDGSHEYVDVIHDLWISENILGDYGVVAVDDFHSVASPGVTEAVIDYLRRTDALVPFAISGSDGSLRSGCSKIFLCRHGAREFYQGLLVTLNKTNFCNWVSACGQRAALFEFSDPPAKASIFPRPV